MFYDRKASAPSCFSCRHSRYDPAFDALRCRHPDLGRARDLIDGISTFSQRSHTRPLWLWRLFGARDWCGPEAAHFEQKVYE